MVVIEISDFSGETRIYLVELFQQSYKKNGDYAVYPNKQPFEI
jgi:hypothetical protein